MRYYTWFIRRRNCHFWKNELFVARRYKVVRATSIELEESRVVTEFLQLRINFSLITQIRAIASLAEEGTTHSRWWKRRKRHTIYCQKHCPTIGKSWRVCNKVLLCAAPEVATEAYATRRWTTAIFQESVRETDKAYQDVVMLSPLLRVKTKTLYSRGKVPRCIRRNRPNRVHRRAKWQNERRSTEKWNHVGSQAIVEDTFMVKNMSSASIENRAQVARSVGETLYSWPL